MNLDDVVNNDSLVREFVYFVCEMLEKLEGIRVQRSGKILSIFFFFFLFFYDIITDCDDDFGLLLLF